MCGWHYSVRSNTLERPGRDKAAENNQATEKLSAWRSAQESRLLLSCTTAAGSMLSALHSRLCRYVPRCEPHWQHIPVPATCSVRHLPCCEQRLMMRLLSQLSEDHCASCDTCAGCSCKRGDGHKSGRLQLDVPRPRLSMLPRRGS